MTKKDYVLIATALKEAFNQDFGKLSEQEIRLRISGEIGKALKLDNPKFNWIKWDEFIFDK